MFDWVLAPGDSRQHVLAAAAKALSGGTLALRALELAPGRVVTVVEEHGARPRRAATWPDVLVDWSEINEEPPHPGAATPALAETLSALGVPAFAVAFDPARDAAAVAWYERGALLLLEHVGRAVVAWSPGEGL